LPKRTTFSCFRILGYGHCRQSTDEAEPFERTKSGPGSLAAIIPSMSSRQFAKTAALQAFEGFLPVRISLAKGIFEIML
jgi:hypothetical protein